MPANTPARSTSIPAEWGVGPWCGPWPDDARLDPELLRAGDQRNVIDEFRYLRVGEIRAELDRRRLGGPQLHVAIENWAHDFNIGSIVRTANAFNAAGVHIVGRRRWNRRGAMVTDRYLHVHHHPTASALVEWLAEHAPNTALIGVDNLPGAEPLESLELPRDCVLVFGDEATGLSAEMQEHCARVVQITQFGSTRSLNAGAAAAIAMFAWSRANRP